MTTRARGSAKAKQEEDKENACAKQNNEKTVTKFQLKITSKFANKAAAEKKPLLSYYGDDKDDDESGDYVYPGKIEHYVVVPKFRVAQSEPWRGNMKNTSLNHLPLDIMSQICGLLSLRSLIALKDCGLFMHRCATSELANRAMELFQVADYKAAIWYKLLDGVEINMGQMQAIFGQSLEDSRQIKHKVEERGKRGRFHNVYIYDRFHAIWYALQKYGSIDALQQRKVRDSKRRQRAFAQAAGNEILAALDLSSKKVSKWVEDMMYVLPLRRTLVVLQFYSDHVEDELTEPQHKIMMESGAWLEIFQKLTREEIPFAAACAEIEDLTEMYNTRYQRLKEICGSMLDQLSEKDIRGPLTRWTDSTEKTFIKKVERLTKARRFIPVLQSVFSLSPYKLSRFHKKGDLKLLLDEVTEFRDPKARVTVRALFNTFEHLSPEDCKSQVLKRVNEMTSLQHPHWELIARAFEDQVVAFLSGDFPSFPHYESCLEHAELILALHPRFGPFRDLGFVPWSRYLVSKLPSHLALLTEIHDLQKRAQDLGILEDCRLSDTVTAELSGQKGALENLAEERAEQKKRVRSWYQY